MHRSAYLTKNKNVCIFSQIKLFALWGIPKAWPCNIITQAPQWQSCPIFKSSNPQQQEVKIWDVPISMKLTKNELASSP